jgi:hypothetical protein
LAINDSALAMTSSLKIDATSLSTSICSLFGDHANGNKHDVISVPDHAVRELINLHPRFDNDAGG